MADTDNVSAAAVVYLHAWKELCRIKLMETFLIAAAITQVGGLYNDSTYQGRTTSIPLKFYDLLR